MIAAVRERVETARQRAVHRRQVDGRPDRHAGRGSRRRHCPIAGLVLLGYPLHPPGRPDQRRDKHLPAIKRPMLFVQGSRDTFGTPAELTPILSTLEPRPVLHVVDNSDHSFKLARRNPGAQAAVHADVQRAIVHWVRDTLAAAHR